MSIEFGGKNFAEKALIEGTPGFRPYMYRHIKDSGEINWRGVAKDVYKLDHSRDKIIFEPVK